MSRQAMLLPFGRRKTRTRARRSSRRGRQLTPVAGPDDLRSIRRWRGVGLTDVVSGCVARLSDASNFAASVDTECDDLLIKRCPADAADDLVMATLIAHKNPARTADVARGGMSAIAGGGQVGDHAIRQPAFNNMPLIGISLADAHIDVATVSIDGHITVARAMMFRPALDQLAVDSQNIRDVGLIVRRG